MKDYVLNTKMMGTMEGPVCMCLCVYAYARACGCLCTCYYYCSQESQWPDGFLFFGGVLFCFVLIPGSLTKLRPLGKPLHFWSSISSSVELRQWQGFVRLVLGIVWAQGRHQLMAAVITIHWSRPRWMMAPRGVDCSKSDKAALRLGTHIWVLNWAYRCL